VKLVGGRALGRRILWLAAEEIAEEIADRVESVANCADCVATHVSNRPKPTPGCVDEPAAANCGDPVAQRVPSRTEPVSNRTDGFAADLDSSASHRAQSAEEEAAYV